MVNRKKKYDKHSAPLTVKPGKFTHVSTWPTADGGLVKKVVKASGKVTITVEKPE